MMCRHSLISAPRDVAVLHVTLLAASLQHVSDGVVARTAAYLMRCSRRYTSHNLVSTGYLDITHRRGVKSAQLFMHLPTAMNSVLTIP